MVRRRRERFQIIMPELQWDVESRVGRVREIAARIYKDVQGEPVRETMHAIALATAALICTNFRGLGQQRALDSHITNVRHHTQRKQQ